MPFDTTIQCPWCKTQYPNTKLTNCTNCGGTLEYSFNSDDLGSEPPNAPRVLPTKFKRRIKYTGNVMTLIGIIFTIPFFWTILFPIIGIYCWRRGLRTANDELIPLEQGKATVGEIIDIRKDYTQSLNGKSPTIVEFVFEVSGKKYTGNVGNIYESVHLTKKIGDKLWIVFMPKEPEISSVWPPLV
ncbi:hypothetical protein [Leptospira kanakyensis]|uniref:DUF3592 domain-containing protein n=1 Tax=Leptospira kanakyensis TaxID=2484968 RepID=A0A6N4QEI4_9LEPT|nr:hypothetical protein [Leptospira kanakyensis]MCW7469256.1 hypothetical protein [Leptospira kanakyensis]MCW7480245.1 hypothetical protein [Leptospira kanakyensis]TGK50445.1 hypothetical protein EHQ11_12195 [Leptospira kanakyensis]TGK63953.1 hypothetical protein EHQ16_05825 [Leptospira kanakyensis]TGK69583.1 hypothetical protein EHQ18_12355 [Leptospira kanakyensis]